MSSTTVRYLKSYKNMILPVMLGDDKTWLLPSKQAINNGAKQVN